MTRSRTCRVLLFGLLLAFTLPRSLAQDAARPHKSVYGKLERVDTTGNSVVMLSDEGEQLAWRFEAPVVAEVARVKPGERIIAIYRQISPSEKRVTAVAFPGAAKTATYVNMTRASVVLRSAPASGGSCGQPGAGPISESTIPAGGRAESLEACWCFGPAGLRAPRARPATRPGSARRCSCSASSSEGPRGTPAPFVTSCHGRVPFSV